MVLSDPSLCWWLSPCKKYMVFTDSLYIYWWSKNPAIWMRCKTHRTQPKVVVSDPSFHWGEMSNKKCKVLIDYFQWYWWSKNVAIWLSERILGNNWRTRFFLDMLFWQNHKNTAVHHFWCKKWYHWIKYFSKAKKPYFGRILGLFP